MLCYTICSPVFCSVSEVIYCVGLEYIVFNDYLVGREVVTTKTHSAQHPYSKRNKHKRARKWNRFSVVFVLLASIPEL